jgi:TIR domain-containing protein
MVRIRRQLKKPDFMFLTIQFPLLDFRFLQVAMGRTERPKWPDPNQKEIARYFGQIIDRGVRYYGPWDDEKRYSNARGVINLCGRGPQHFFTLLHESGSQSRILFRRFQSDGKLFAKFDIGINDEFEQSLNAQPTDKTDLRKLIFQHVKKYLLCPVKIKVGSRLSPFISLIDAGKYLRSAYFWSTYAGKKSFDPKELTYQVENGEPEIILQIDSGKLDLACFEQQKIEIAELSKENIQLFFDYIPYTQGRTSFKAKSWIIGVPVNKNNSPVLSADFGNYNQAIRFLRVNLLKIHQEKNILKRLLEVFGGEEFKKRDEANKEIIFRYLHKKVLNLSKVYRNTQSQDKLIGIAFRLDETCYGAENFDNQIEGLKYYIEWLEKTIDMQEKQAAIDYLKSSTTSINSFLNEHTFTVFISYNHADESIANKLAQKLQQKNIRVILDSQSMLAGTDIKTFIYNSIKMSQATISILSKDSLQSAWVGIETINTISYKNFYPDTKYIPCYIDKAFFKDDFVLECVNNIDKRMEAIDLIILEQNKLKINSDNFNDEKSRLYVLRNNIGSIVGTLKEGLCVDISEGNFENNFPEILSAISNTGLK